MKNPVCKEIVYSSVLLYSKLSQETRKQRQKVATFSVAESIQDSIIEGEKQVS